MANTNTIPINVGKDIRATRDSFGMGQTNFFVKVCIMLVINVDGFRISMKFTSLMFVFVTTTRSIEFQSISRRLSIVYKTNGIRYARPRAKVPGTVQHANQDA